MFYYMTSFLLLATLVTVSFVHGVPLTNDIADSCEAHFYASDSCSGTISSRNCKASTINLGNTNISTCTSVGLFWSYPTGNLTMTIETPFTQKQQAYTIYADNQSLRGAITRVYRVFNGQETEVTTTDEKLIQYSDANYQIILKLQGPPKLSYYGVFINYEVTKM